ncbi:MAG: hypothetical protein LBI04_02600 [Treponema sp.]|jgi:TolB-like protein|nr:hypothetical protein [Treponema sp.]
MKKQFFCITLLIMLIMGCAGSAKATAAPAENSAANSDGMTLDQALKEAALRIDERLAAKTKIAPLNFNSPHDKFSGYVLDELTANLVDSRKLTVVDRKEIDLIRGEFDFQLSGDVGDDSMQELGRMLGAEAIISGSLTDMGGFYRIVIRVLNVQNASVEVQHRANIVSDNITTALLTGGKAAVAARSPQRTPAISAPSTPAPAAILVQAEPVPAPADTPTTYKIGDKGPAGGLIFYDKGNNSGGWRYLEAAPVETETTAQWRHKSGALSDISSLKNVTSREIGMGLTNTQNIMRYFTQNGGGFGLAIQVCDELAVNGFDDWFLPSLDELSYMYGNLYRRGIGGFRSEGYYSSTIITGNFGNGYAPSRINFQNGEPAGGGSDVSRRVRAARRF